MGDWKKERYKIKHLQDPDDVKSGDNLEIIALSPAGEIVGRLLVYINSSSSTIAASDVNVNEEHRRKGLASAMYEHAEKLTGKPMVSANEFSGDEMNMTDDARAFWDQPKRKFGR